MVTCPLCTKIGLLLLSIGFTVMLLGAIEIISNQFIMLIGLGFVISAYIVPNLIKSNSCKDSSCEVKQNGQRK